jgi:membrane protease YdiL (CAAX protease family)
MATSVQTTPVQGKARRTLGLSLVVGYLVVYAGALFTMHRTTGFDVSEPIFALAILGIGFSVMAWLLTIGASPLPYPIAKPEKELTTVGFYFVAVVVFVTWGLGLLHKVVPAGPAEALTILAAKLLVFVVVPAALFRAQFCYGFRRLAPFSGSFRHVIAMLGISALLLAFQAVFGRGLRDLAEAHLSPTVIWLGVPLTLMWVSLEAGVVEEFFFRVLMQTRLSAVLKSELAAIVATSLCFGLLHAPGLYLRTRLTQEGLPSHPSLLMAVGYSIVVTSVAGFMFGVLWARTRNFPILVVAHGMADLLPNILPTISMIRL